jgi:ubiquinone/menaquinone biosynthesis C-methylase UbiE
MRVVPKGLWLERPPSEFAQQIAVSCNLAECNRPESVLKLSGVQAAQIDAKLAPLLGELAWHSLTLDTTIEDVSAGHYAAVERVMKQYLQGDLRGTHILEVAAYAHITGYQLHKELEATVDLFDISASTLRLGRRIAQEKNLPLEGTSRTMGDFHELPYENDQFDVVHICSALHHTLRWQQVLAELIRVLAPDGILFLGNEPTRRDFCFNTFRTNRTEFFTPFEKKLDELGIIRTVAEAYLGSRPETLFRMVENQTMQLGEILGSRIEIFHPRNSGSA